MKKKFCIIGICILVLSDLNAKDISLSLNYLYIGAKGRYALNIPKSLDSHGIGVQGNIRLKNSFYLLADAGYYFDSHYKTNESTTSFVESYLSCSAINANFAYRIGGTKFSAFPYIGVGLFDEYAQQRYKSEGVGYQPGSGLPFGQGAPYDIIQKDHSIAVMGNIGLSVEYSVTDKIFLTGGIKYMADVYSSKYNAFPCLNVGLGYRF